MKASPIYRKSERYYQKLTPLNIIDRYLLMSYAIAFITTALLIWILIPIAVNYGLVDIPGKRKNHKGNVPLIGGLAMFGGLVFSALTVEIPITPYKSYFAGGFLLLIIGLMDDQYDLKPISKFFVQIVVAFLMISWGELVINSLGAVFSSSHPIQLSNWAIPFTVFYSVGAINALNMSDGLDGLAGGSSFITHLSLLTIALWQGRNNDAVFLMLILMVLLGFLIFNLRLFGRKRALLFMGDGGSLFLGFSIVWFSISLSQGEKAVVRPVTCLWFYAIPLFDTVSLIFRRVSKRQSPFFPDRTHLHHILIRAGFSVNKAVFIILMLVLAGCLVGLAGEYYAIPENIMFGSYLSTLFLYCLGMTRARKFVRYFLKRRRRFLLKKTEEN